MRYTTRAALAGALLLTVLPIEARAQEDTFHFSFGSGLTVPNSEVRDQLGDGYNVNIGIQFDLTPVIGIEALFATNPIGDRQLSIPVSPAPGAPSVPANFSVNMSMQFATANLVVQQPTGRIRPYGVVGTGVYNRPVQVTTTASGWMPGQCDRWWYVCDPRESVPVDAITGERAATDFGIGFGGGVNFWTFLFTEVRYHYIWGPTIEAPQGTPPALTPAPQKANGRFFMSTIGVRF